MGRGRKPQGGQDASRRDDLLKAAARLFVDKGFAATTTRDIADAVGMRSGSPFYHFRSKHDLLKAVMIDGLTSGLARLEAAIAGVDDAELRLQRLIRGHLANLLEGDCHSPLLLGETRALDEAARAEITAAFDRYQLPWQATLDTLAREGKLASSAPPVRLFIFGMLNWTPHWYRASGPLSVDELANSALDLLLKR